MKIVKYIVTFLIGFVFACLILMFLPGPEAIIILPQTSGYKPDIKPESPTDDAAPLVAVGLLTPKKSVMDSAPKNPKTNIPSVPEHNMPPPKEVGPPMAPDKPMPGPAPAAPMSSDMSAVPPSTPQPKSMPAPQTPDVNAPQPSQPASGMSAPIVPGGPTTPAPSASVNMPALSSTASASTSASAPVAPVPLMGAK